MVNFISDFFENRGWLGILQQNKTTLALQVGGSELSNSYTIATMPDASTVAVGSIINIPRTEFANSGGNTADYMPAYGIYLQSNGVNWEPAFGSQTFAVVATGTETTPILNEVVGSGINSTNAFALASGSPSIPAELMYVGLRVRVEMIMGKGSVSTGSSIPLVLFGSNSTLASNSQMIKGGTITTGANFQSFINSFATVTSTTAFSGPVGDPSSGAALIPNAGAGVNPGSGVTGFQTYSSTLSFVEGQKNYIVPAFYAAAGGVADTHDLFYFRVVLES